MILEKLYIFTGLLLGIWQFKGASSADVSHKNVDMLLGSIAMETVHKFLHCFAATASQLDAATTDKWQGQQESRDSKIR